MAATLNLLFAGKIRNAKQGNHLKLMHYFAQRVVKNFTLPSSFLPFLSSIYFYFTLFLFYSELSIGVKYGVEQPFLSISFCLFVCFLHCGCGAQFNVQSMAPFWCPPPAPSKKGSQMLSVTRLLYLNYSRETPYSNFSIFLISFLYIFRSIQTRRGYPRDTRLQCLDNSDSPDQHGRGRVSTTGGETNKG